MRGARRLLPTAVLLSCAACGVTDVERVVVRDARVDSAGPLARTLTVTLEHAAPITVEWSADDGPILERASASASTHTLLLTRLRADREYTYRIVGTSHTGRFRTHPLPEELARISFDATGRPTTPLTMLHLYDPDGFRGYVALDADAEVVWYFRTQDLAFGMTRRANGNFVFMDKVAGLLEVAPAGDVVNRLPQDFDRGEMHHDVLATDRGTILFIAFDERPFDGGTLRGESIWEWTPESGGLVKRWSSWDELDPAVDRGPRFGTEWMHANALAHGAGGTILVSVHYFNQVLALAPDFSRILWRLGGVNATIHVESEPFSGQHTAREIAPGRIVLFDNGVDRGGPSRALELELDGDTARTVWEWYAPTENYGSAVGSARRLDNGNTLVGFGMSDGVFGSRGGIEVYEVGPVGNVVWHVDVTNGWLMYRAEPVETIGGEVGGARGPGTSFSQ